MTISSYEATGPSFSSPALSEGTYTPPIASERKSGWPASTRLDTTLWTSCDTYGLSKGNLSARFRLTPSR
ncbi:hypothetical protein SEA_HALLEY_60 [Mycobacterium phage Halley]|nr:hypothetical protein SEA_HALLEY_60 [Mycobacterium phage Halley]QBI97687.1 hypothetical protein SEA_HUGHESYANG_58 [Mycobacterium phage Hughesyang]QDM58054.1 hypothetical protein SEA_NIHILNOMEN_59 [Mycobacterium phage NihilNomen]